MVLTICVILGHVPWTKCLLEGRIFNLYDIGPKFSEKKPFENVDRQLTFDLLPR